MLFHKIALGLAVGSLALASQNASALSLNAGATQHGYTGEFRQSLLPFFTLSAGYFESSPDGFHEHNSQYRKEHGDTKDQAYSGALMFSPFVPGLDLAVGVRYQYQDTQYGKGTAVSLGGSAFVETPIPRTDIGGYGYYTPKGWSNGDIHTSEEYGAQMRFHLIGETYVYGGYRVFRTDFLDRNGQVVDNGKNRHTLDRGPMVGLSVGF